MRTALGIVTATLVLALSANAANIDELIQKMKDKDIDTRRLAAKELADAGAEAKPALGVLIKALKDKDVYVRRFSAQAIGSIGPDAKPALSALRALLLDTRESKDVQEAAAGALGKMGSGGVETLIAALKDKNKEPEVRRKATEALGQIGPDAHSAVAPLVEALKGGAAGKKGPANNADIRGEIVTALGQIASYKDEDALSALQAVAAEKSKNKTLKTAANDAIRMIKARK